MGIALLLAALVCEAGEPPAENLTWQEANKRSAALIKEKGASVEAADLARAAFDLYPQQSKSYNANNHAQLLLNLTDVRHKASGVNATLKEFDRGAQAIVRYAGPNHPVLVDVWREGAGIRRGSQSSVRYYEQAVALAEQVWGVDDPRTIEVLLDMTHGLRTLKGYEWAAAKYLAARERAAKAGEDSALVAQVDLVLAKLQMEAGRKSAAIEGYRNLIDRLEKRTDRDLEPVLETAYAQLEYAYEESGDKETAAAMHRRRTERLLGKGDVLVPLMRVQPQYPRRAAKIGQKGAVELDLTIGPDGSVRSAKVVHSEPPGVFDESALEAVQKWKFKPKIVDGQPVESSGKQVIEYLLE